MTFGSGQRLGAADLNAITPFTLDANVTADDTLTTSEVDLSGATLSVTTIVANTKLRITASLDCEASGASDFSFVRLYVAGAVQTANLKWQMAGRVSLARTWVVTIGSAGTITVNLTRQKIGSANTTKVYSGHSNLVVVGNGIS